VDRARAIAREYREALTRADPAQCAVLDRAAAEFGETWLTGAVQHTDSELLTLTDLAELLGEKRGTVWAWWNRGRIPREPSGLFRVDAVEAALVAWRVARENTNLSDVAPLPSLPPGSPCREAT
jgi:hypothetical protein